MITYIKVSNLIKLAGEVKQNNVLEAESEKVRFQLNSFYENTGCLFNLHINSSLYMSYQKNS